MCAGGGNENWVAGRQHTAGHPAGGGPHCQRALRLPEHGRGRQYDTTARRTLLPQRTKGQGI